MMCSFYTSYGQYYFAPPKLNLDQLRKQAEAAAIAHNEENTPRIHFDCKNIDEVQSMTMQRIFMLEGDASKSYCYDLITIKFFGDSKFYKYRFYNNIKALKDYSRFDSLARGKTKSGNVSLSYEDGSECWISVNYGSTNDELKLKSYLNPSIPSKRKYVFIPNAEMTRLANGMNNSRANNTYMQNDPYSSSSVQSVKCSLCNGRGWIPGSSTPTYGNFGEHYCYECGKTVSNSHSHDRCPSCNGKGTTTHIR